jgi:hypothetical protein
MNLNCKGEYKLFGGLIKLTNSSVLSVFYGNNNGTWMECSCSFKIYCEGHILEFR